VRTLVISDLHLGSRLGRDVLRHPEAVEALVAALDGIDRLVLLGDVVELIEARRGEALRRAESVLAAIGKRMGPDREVVMVTGNHDAELVTPWVRAMGSALGVDARVPHDATEALARVTGALAPARVRVHTPGVWLTERVWATHGHYLDRHLLPETAFGLARGLLGGLPRDGALPIDYEDAGGPSLTRVEGRLTQLPRPLARLADELEEAVRAATMADLVRWLQGHRLAPLSRLLLGTQMQRAAIPALARVVHRLGIDAEWVIFGHVHRSGPHADDDPALWAGPGGRPRLANTGSWVYEPLLLHRGTPPHPYWPGGAILLDDDGDPRPVGLLDGLDVPALHRRPR
jgi:predicted phosphodiesterase